MDIDVILEKQSLSKTEVTDELQNILIHFEKNPDACKFEIEILEEELSFSSENCKGNSSLSIIGRVCRGSDYNAMRKLAQKYKVYLI